MLWLLASDKAQMYMRDNCFLYWMVVSKKSGDIIGEQALLNRAPRNATLVALTPINLLVLDKSAFDEYMGAAQAKQEERVAFFSTCFPTIQKRSLGNFNCMFQRIVKTRGDVLTIRGDMSKNLYLIEEGEVAIVNHEKIKSSSTVQVA